MDLQEQTHQTEKIIIEMLDFLETTSDEDDDFNNITVIDQENKEQENKELKCKAMQIDSSNNKKHNNSKDNRDTVTKAKFLLTENKKNVKKSNSAENKTKTSIADELYKLKQIYPIWNTKEICTNNTKKSGYEGNCSISTKEQDTISEDWEKTLNDFALDGKEHQSSYDEWGVDVCDKYSQEINKAICGDSTQHPLYGSQEYFQAAQNYAIYGTDFFDFPENHHALNTADMNMKENASGFGAISLNNLGKFYPNNIMATSLPTGTTGFYQLQPAQQMRQSFNPGTAYGMFFGNKITYYAAAPSYQIAYNQQPQHCATTTTTNSANFISNTLANAVLATSTPAILYTNPVMTTTTQQFSNSFYNKDTVAKNGILASSAQAATATGVYERIIYAQMLQQQIYHHSQQHVAALMQYKQRSSSVATVAKPSLTSTTLSGKISPTISKGSTTAVINSCARQAASVCDIKSSNILFGTKHNSVSKSVPPGILAHSNENSPNNLND